MPKIYLLLIVIPFLFNSCLVIHSGNVSSGPLPNSNVSYVDIARGNSKSVFVFGLGNLKNDGLVVKAKYDMYRNRPVKENEFYSNFTTSITDKCIFLFAHVTRVNVSADVLKPKAENSEDTFSEGFKKIIWRVPDSIRFQNKISGEMLNGQTLNEGDTVYYYFSKTNKYILYTVSSISKESALLMPIIKSYENIIEILPEKKNTLTSHLDALFLKSTTIGELKHGDKVLIEVRDYYYNYNDGIHYKKINGTVLGCAKNQILTETDQGTVVVEKERVKKIP